jgi:phosphoribosylformylglycinamidine cyclo-ligase
MQQIGKIEEPEMFRTFNMGIGMVIVCSAEDAITIRSRINQCFEIGRVCSGDQRVELID